MANGHFLGGFADGYQKSRQIGINEAEQAANAHLRERAQRLAESNAAAANRRELLAESDKEIGKIWDVMKDDAEKLHASGTRPEIIEGMLAANAQHAVDILYLTGRDPEPFKARVKSLVTRPAAPATDLGRLEADRRAGYVDDATAAARKQAIATEEGPSALELVRRKIMRGEQLEDGEAKLYDDSLKGDPLTRAIFNRVLGVETTTTPAGPVVSAPAPRKASAVKAQPRSFATAEEYQAARQAGEVQPGDRVIVNGRSGTVK